MTSSQLNTVLTLLASMGGVAGLLAYLRKAGLDHLLSGLDGTQQNAILRGLLILLNYGAILLGLLAQSQPMSGNLLLEAAKLTAGAVIGGHLLFTGLQKTPAPLPEPSEIPVDGPGIPPTTTTPASSAAAAADPVLAALDPAA